jgi:hypothetical protein
VAWTRGCHVIGKGKQAQALLIIPQIITAQGLLINTAMMGTAAWGFYINMVPSRQGQLPMVVFDVEDKYVKRKNAPLPNNLQYAYMEMYAPNITHIPISVLGFVNVLNPLLPIYAGTIGFF